MCSLPRSLAILFLVLVLIPAAHAQRQMEKLGRGVLALRTTTGSSSSNPSIYVGWRLLGNDPEDIAFNVYRSANGAAAIKVNSTPIATTTNYTDTTVPFSTITTIDYTYSVKPLLKTDGVNYVEVPDTWASPSPLSGFFILPRNAPVRQYLPVTLQPTPDDPSNANYRVNLAWVGDLDGDGEYDFVVERTNIVTYSSRQWIQAYKRDGTLLWQMTQGTNSMEQDNVYPGSSTIAVGHNDNVTVYDLDGDGKAEVIVLTAKGVIFNYGTAGQTTLNAPNNEVQYISVIDGQTGVEKAHAQVPIPAAWPNQNHVSGHFGILYSDGIRPSFIFQYANRNADESWNKTAATWDYRSGQLTQRWVWNPTGHVAEGHQIRLADVDNDGRDEYVDIGHIVKADGSGQINGDKLTEVVHGDRFHITDIDPDRPGMETFLIQQNNPTGLTTMYHSADKGALIKKWYAGAVIDVGRGVAGSFVPNAYGLQMFSTASGMLDRNGNEIYSASPWPTETVWWDADLYREMLNNDAFAIDEFNPSNPDAASRVQTLYNDSAAPNGNYQANGGRPAFWGDILGDWREEVVVTAWDFSELRIYATKTVDTAKTFGGANFRIYTLMHNPQYRDQATTKGYVQSSYVDYYLGYGMQPPPPPPMVDAKLVWKGGTGTSTWDAGATSNWLNNGIGSTFANGDTVRFDISGNSTTTVALTGNLQPGAVTVYSPTSYTFDGTSGAITGTTKLTKAGAGTLTLTGTHSFTGKTTVWDGALLVNGNLQSSPVTVWGGTWGGALAAGKTGGRVAGTGSFGQPVTIKYRGAITPGAGMNSAGTLTFANGLTAEDGTAFALDLSDDPTGATKPNDRIAVNGNLALTGTTTLVINSLNATLGAGTYTLVTYTGTLTGSLSNLAIVVPVGTPYTLSAGSGTIKLTVPTTRAAASVTWRGSGAIWDLANSQNWLRAGSPDVFVAGDNVTFDATGAAATTATLATVLPVTGVTVNANTNYTFSGTGSLTGSGGLTKSGTGTLTINTANSYTGPTLINGGVLAVSALGDAGSPSAIGASTGVASNFVLNGGTLRLTTSQTNTDRNVTLGASGGTFDITSASSSIQISGVLSGSGTLTKSGSGTLLLAAANTYAGGTVINGGKIYLAGSTANENGLGTGSVTINNGTLSMADVQNNDVATWNVVVPAGGVARLDADGRCSLTGSLTGSGTLTFYSPYVRTDTKGNWSAFTGRIITIGELRIANSFGYANAALQLGGSAYYNLDMGSNLTLAIGELSGPVAATLTGGPTSGKTLTWQVGAKNTSSTFAGIIKNSTSTTALTKVGTGTLTLGSPTSMATTITTGSTTVKVATTSGLRASMKVVGTGIPAGTVIASVDDGTTLTLSAAASSTGSPTLTYTTVNTYTGATTVSAGKLALNGASLSGTSVAVASGAGFGGNGSVTGNVVFNAGSILLANPAAGPLAVTGNLIFSGPVTVAPAFGAVLSAGTFPLYTATSVTGTPSFTWSGSGYSATFNTSVPGQASITLVALPRAATDLVWTGSESADGLSAVWDSSTKNWIWSLGTTAFQTDDRVRFDDNSTINAVTLSGSLAPASVTVDSTQDYTFAGTGPISGAATLIKSGSGNLTISTAQTFTGGSTINAGTVTVNNSTGLGTGTINLAGGTIGLGAALSNPINVTSTGNQIVAGSSNRSLFGAFTGDGVVTVSTSAIVTISNVTNFAGTISMGASAGTFRANSSTFSGGVNWALDLGTNTAGYSRSSSAATVNIGALSGGLGTALYNGTTATTYSIGAKNVNSTFSGAITGAASLVKTGAASLTLAGTNTYTGTTAVSTGSLLVTGSLGTSGVLVSVSSGATIGGTGTLGGNLTLASGARLALGIGDSVTKGLTVAGTSTLNGAITVVPALLGGTLAPGTYTVLTYSGTLGGSPNFTWLDTTSSGYVGTFTIDTSSTPRQVKITLVAPPAAPSGLVATPGNGQVGLSWDAVSSATSYIVRRSTTSGSSYVDLFPAATTNSYTNTGLTNGTTYYYVVAAKNAAGTSGNSNEASAKLGETYSQWAAAAFPGQTDPNVMGPNADPDMDGYPNLLEDFFGTLPNTANAQSGVTCTPDGQGNIVMTFPMSKNLSNVSYQVRKSTDMSTWEDTNVTPTVDTDQGTYYLMKAIVPQGTDARLFLLLKVTAN